MASDSALSSEVAQFLRNHTTAPLSPSSSFSPNQNKKQKAKPKQNRNRKQNPKQKQNRKQKQKQNSNQTINPNPNPNPNNKPKPLTTPSKPKPSPFKQGASSRNHPNSHRHVKSPIKDHARTLLLGAASEDGTPWYTLLSSLSAVKGGSAVKHKRSREQIGQSRVKISAVHEREIALYQELKEASNDAEYIHIQRVVESGTLSDKIAGLTLLVSNAAVYNLRTIDKLLSMVERKGKREAKLAAEALKELFLTHLLPPDRPLVSFQERPLMKAKVSDKHALLWLFEDMLKERYLRFVRGMEGLTFDNLDHVKRFAIRATLELLQERCEQEQLLLIILVNKLADTQRKIASDVVFLLHKLVAAHPNMRMVIVEEVEQYLFNPNRSKRALYNGIIFLNQIQLVRDEDVALARKLLDIYVRIFDTVFASGEQGRPIAGSETSQPSTRKPKGKAKSRHRKGGKKGLKAPVDLPEMSSSRILSALLTGVNRAFPYAKSSGDELAQQVETLFRISHQGSFNTGTQALMVLLHMMKSSNTVSDRFYRALYAHLLNPDFHSSSKQTLFLNLLYRALKADVVLDRSRAFIKRLLQVACVGSAQFAAGTLFLLSKVIEDKPELATMLRPRGDPGQSLPTAEEKSNEDPRRPTPKILIVGDQATVAKQPSALMNVNEDAGATVSELPEYDATKRDPLHAGTPEGSVAWEISLLARHYHPSVRSFVESMTSSQKCSIKYDGDPLRDFSNSAFLDRFVYRNPRKRDIENINKASVFGSAGRLGRQGKSAVAAAVNSPSFLLQQPGKIASNERFFYQFFQQKANLEGKSLVQEMTLAKERAKMLKRKQDNPFAEFEEDEEEEAFAEKLAEKLLQESAGGRAADQDDEDGIDFDYSSDEEDTQAGSSKKNTAKPVLRGSDDEDEEARTADMASDDSEEEDPFQPSILSGSKGSGKSVFASAEDYEQYIDEGRNIHASTQRRKRRRKK